MSDELLVDLRALAESCDDFVADIEFVSAAQGAELLEGILGQAVPELSVFAQTGAGCLLATWGERVAWIDSEGGPSAVVAGSIHDFVSLLMLDTGAMHDILTAWDNHRQRQSPPPGANARLRDVKSMMAAAADLNPDHVLLVSWAAEHGIKPPADPVALIGTASDQAPTLHALLTEKGIEL